MSFQLKLLFNMSKKVEKEELLHSVQRKKNTLKWIFEVNNITFLQKSLTKLSLFCGPAHSKFISKSIKNVFLLETLSIEFSQNKLDIIF